MPNVRPLRDLSLLCSEPVAQVLAGKRIDIDDLGLSPDERQVVERAICRAQWFLQRHQTKGHNARLFANEWKPGQALRDKYTVVKKLGAGGMGEVYLVRRDRDGRELAAKRVRDPVSGGPLDILSVVGSARNRQAALLDEIIRGMQLPPHPNVLRCEFFDVVDHGFVLFTDYMRYGSLARCLDDGVLFDNSSVSGEQFLALAKQTLNGLMHLHYWGMVHQDIKPENILIHRLEGGLHCVIADFGIAREQTDGMAVLAGLDPRYASPEQKKGGNLSDRSDVYSWAVTMLATASRNHAHPFNCGSPPSRESIDRFLNEELHLEHAGLAEALTRSLATTPDQRPSAAELNDIIAEPDYLRSCETACLNELLVNDDLMPEAYLINRMPDFSEQFSPRKRSQRSSPQEELLALISTEIVSRAADDGDLNLDAKGDQVLEAVFGEDEGAYQERMLAVCDAKTRKLLQRGNVGAAVELLSQVVSRADYANLPHRQREALAQARLALLMHSGSKVVPQTIKNRLKDASRLLSNRGDRGMRELVNEVQAVLRTPRPPGKT